MNSPLFIRADGSARIGTGHVMRSLALAQGWLRAGGRAVFAQAETTPGLEQRLRAEGMEIARLTVMRGSVGDAEQTIGLARTSGAKWVVADGYCFDSGWQKRIRDAGLRLLVIDDYGQADQYYADIVLNQNLAADGALYARCEFGTCLLLGSRYALLRREFLNDHRPQRTIPEIARNVLVTLGGSDPDNITAKVITALECIDGIETVIVVGASNPNISALKSAVNNGNPSMRLAVNATDMSELMAWADIAISAAGSTVWELAYMGLPAILIVLADNQADVAAAIDRQGISISLGLSHTFAAKKVADVFRALQADSVRRYSMSQKACSIIDGDGVARVITRMLAKQLKLRRADQNDCALFWKWVNDPAVRASAFNPEVIEWETHKNWFYNKLHKSSSIIYVGLGANEEPVGQVRFDCDGGEVAEIDVSVDHSHRMGGIGPVLIRRAVDELFTTTRITSVDAAIKIGNNASIRAFEKAGFTRTEVTPMGDCEAVWMNITAYD